MFRWKQPVIEWAFRVGQMDVLLVVRSLPFVSIGLLLFSIAGCFDGKKSKPPIRSDIVEEEIGAYGALIEIRGKTAAGRPIVSVGACWASTGERRLDKGTTVSSERLIDGYQYDGISFLYENANPGDLDDPEFTAFCIDPANSFLWVFACVIERNGRHIIDIYAWSSVKWRLRFPGIEDFVLQRSDDRIPIHEPYVFKPGDYHLEVVLQ